jgi:hypothetical protein
MEKIKDLINRFIDIEKKIEESFRANDIEKHNNLVDHILELSGEDIIPSNKLKIPLSEAKQRKIEMKKDIPVESRYLYKISEYVSPKYDKIWVCYTSVSDPISGRTKLISDFYILAYIEEQGKIVAQFKIDPDTYKWRFIEGDEDINYYKLGKPVAIERLLSPENDEWSIEEYLKDK